jgi:hypothetical protein|tara:strand:+ start:16154 stop:16579 length:426 start_codon:yes stop_codon:yes gene_type:complete
MLSEKEKSKIYQLVKKRLGAETDPSTVDKIYGKTLQRLIEKSTDQLPQGSQTEDKIEQSIQSGNLVVAAFSSNPFNSRNLSDFISQLGCKIKDSTETKLKNYTVSVLILDPSNSDCSVNELKTKIYGESGKLGFKLLISEE